jgi:hypothetical protein
MQQDWLIFCQIKSPSHPLGLDSPECHSIIPNIHFIASSKSASSSSAPHAGPIMTGPIMAGPSLSASASPSVSKSPSSSPCVVLAVPFEHIQFEQSAFQASTGLSTEKGRLKAKVGCLSEAQSPCSKTEERRFKGTPIGMMP